MEIRECLSFDDVLLSPKYSNLNSRNDANISCNLMAMPIIMSPMNTVTSFKMIKLFIDRGLIATVHRYFKTPEEQLNLVKKIPCNFDNQYVENTFFAVGSIKNCKEWINYLYNNNVHNFLIDMAHGDSELCIETVKYLNKLRQYDSKNKNKIVMNIMAGNVATRSAYSRLEEAGANYIRVGIGGGSICSTRTSTGFGVPQFTSIQDCASRKSNSFLIADGGIKNNGDIVKAIAAGANFVMLGKVLAGTSLASGPIYDKNKELIWNENPNPCNIVYKGYYGMASKKARDGVMKNASIEGVAGLIPYTGETEEILKDIKLNLKSALSYNGSRNWKDFQRTVKILKVSNSSIAESRTHVI